MEITEELKAKAMTCKTAEELLALAADNGIELSAEEAELVLQEMNETREGELADEDLDDVAGGAEGCKPGNPYRVVYWKTEAEVQFIFKEGDIVQAFPTLWSHHTATCKVVNRRTLQSTSGWIDQYWLEKEPGVKTPFLKSWVDRCSIEQ